MDANRTLALFERLVEIESPSWHEAEMARACEAELQGLGFTVVFDGSAEQTGSEVGNLIAHRPGNADGAVAFSAHMDTVKPCAGISVMRVEDDRGEVLCSAGDTILSADDKAGITAIFEGIRSVLEAGEALPDVWVILTTCEEQSLLGSGALKAADAPLGVDCFVLDADGAPGSVVCSAPCHHTMEVAIHGKSAHAGVEPEAGVSAIQVAAHAITNMQLGRLDEATTANVGMIEGGVATNIVADACSFQAECRSLFPERTEEVKRQMTDAVMRACGCVGAEADISWTLDYPEVACAEEDAIVRRAKRAIEACGLPFQAVCTGGGADANCLRGLGVNAITLGTGMTNFHATTEYIEVQDLLDDARLVEALIREYTGS